MDTPKSTANNGGSFAWGNGPTAPFSWRNGYQTQPPYRATWDGTFGDPMYKV